MSATPPPPLFFTFFLIHPLRCHMLLCSSKPITRLTAAIHKYTICQNQFSFKGIQGRLLCAPFSTSQGVCSLHTCCLSCRSLLCAGGPLPPAEEARLLPHPDLHPSHHGCGAVTGLLLDQQGVCSCPHCRRYPPSPLPPQRCGAAQVCCFCMMFQ